MSVVELCGFEMGNFLDLWASSGTFSIQSTIKRTGSYALKINPTGTAVGYGGLAAVNAAGQLVGMDLANVYARFYFRAETLPASSSEEIFMAQSTTASVKLTVRITSAGKLQVYDNTGTTQLGSDGATTLSTGTWYRIEVLVGTGGSANYELKIDGITELSGTGDLLTSNNKEMAFGKVLDRNGQSVEFYYDDIYIDDAAFPGAGQIEVMQADGVGTYTDWTVGAGAGADWENVDEIPHDSNTTYLLSVNSGDASTVTLESAAAAGISGVIKCVKGVLVVRENVIATSAHSIRVRSGSTDSDSSDANLITQFRTQVRLLESDPADGLPWTTADLDGLEVGGVQNNAAQIRMTAAYVMVDFDPDGVAPTGHPAMRRWGGVPGMAPGRAPVGRGW